MSFCIKKYRVLQLQTSCVHKSHQLLSEFYQDLDLDLMKSVILRVTTGKDWLAYFVENEIVFFKEG